MDYENNINTVLHWNYRGLTEFPLERLEGEVDEITDIYLKENLISRIPSDIGKLYNLESLYLSGNDITELPKDISKLIRLKCLDISGNRLKYIPDEIGQVMNLKFLILDENEIQELPLRIAELRMLRYLSVCDNKLKWLPQRPVYNYYHCEFRFWRNPNLKAIPYSLWYHMFRGQQTRSLNIGCLNYKPLYEDVNEESCIQLNQNIDINFPIKYKHIVDRNVVTVPSLFELSKRKMYEIISNTAKSLTNFTPSIYSDIHFYVNNNNINNENLQEDLQNNNTYEDIRENQNIKNRISVNNIRNRYCVPASIIEEYFYYLPKVMKDDLCNGPVSRCENIICKKPIFDYVYLEFCVEKVTLIEATEDVILSASFCSKFCADSWKTGKNLLNWKFV